MSKIKILAPVFLVVVVAVLIRVELYGTPQAAASSNTGLVGTVKSSDGKPMEGVTISARANAKTFTTSVYTDQNGEYFFPPLDTGQYKIWAQAKGFEAGRSELEVVAGKKIQRNFTLNTLEDFHKQLSGSEWMASLPEDTPQDRRMKVILNNNCSQCHQLNVPLHHRFDADGWGAIVNYMENHSAQGYLLPEMLTPGSKRGEGKPILTAYKEEIIEYLTRVRGPDSHHLKYKIFPRPTGEAAQIVVTEYDIPPGDRPGWIKPGLLSRHNGSDWSEGPPSPTYGGKSAHDVVVDKQGIVWWADSVTSEGTVGKLDPRTGRTTYYKLPMPDKGNRTAFTHGLQFDEGGNVWLTTDEGTLTKFDPKTEKFQLFPRLSGQPGSGGNVAEVDSKGNAWSSVKNGVTKLDPRTGKYTDYYVVMSGRSAHAYGLAIDAEDNAWFVETANDRIFSVDSQTGKITILSQDQLDPRDLNIEVTYKDFETARILAATGDSTPFQRGPIRMGADKNGDTVWINLANVGRLAKVDIHTKKIKEYPLPDRWGRPYSAHVDKNHMVWICMLNSDRIAKFNPFTEQFTEYPLPTLGTGIRYIEVDDTTDSPTVWVPYYMTNKIARVQFRGAGATE